MKIIKLILFICISIQVYANNLALKKSGITIDYNEQDIQIKRIHNSKCAKLRASPSMVWSKDFVSSMVPNECKKTYITSVGVITPINMKNKVETLGELEVINFIQEAQLDENMLLIDARLKKWYVLRTIPTAINIPFNQINEEKYEYENILKVLGVIINKNDELDFTNSKTLAFIDNGPWCMQSTWAIQNLIKLGYSPLKIKWYRGGLQGWTILGLTTVVPNNK